MVAFFLPHSVCNLYQYIQQLCKNLYRRLLELQNTGAKFKESYMRGFSNRKSNAIVLDGIAPLCLD
jgi:hypothetical protein